MTISSLLAFGTPRGAPERSATVPFPFFLRFDEPVLGTICTCAFLVEIDTSWTSAGPHFFSRAFSIVFGNVVPCPPSRAVSHK